PERVAFARGGEPSHGLRQRRKDPRRQQRSDYSWRPLDHRLPPRQHRLRARPADTLGPRSREVPERPGSRAPLCPPDAGALASITMKHSLRILASVLVLALIQSVASAQSDPSALIEKL